MVKTLGSAGGTVIEIQVDAGGTVAKDHYDGFHVTGPSALNVTIAEGPYVNYIRPQSVTAMPDLLQAHPDVKAVCAHTDDMTLGARQVLTEINRRDVKVVGVDGLMEAVTARLHGARDVATALNAPDSEEQLAIRTAVKVAKGDWADTLVDAGTGLVVQLNEAYDSGSRAFA